MRRHYRDPDHWSPRSFADEIRENPQWRELRVTVVGPEKGPMTRVRCRCSRLVPAVALVDVRHLPEEWAPGDWACDGCWTRWTRPGPRQRASEAEWRAGHGAPRAEVQRAEALEAGRRARGWQTEDRGRVPLEGIPDRPRDPQEMRDVLRGGQDGG